MLTVPAVTANVADVVPCATATLAGTPAAAEFELDSDTTAPPEGAADVIVTVPVPDCPLTIMPGLTATPPRADKGGLIVTGNVELAAAYDAVNVTAVGLVTVPPLSVNVVELAPCAIVTLEGIVATAGDELSVIVAPALGAAPVRATVHVAAAGGVIDNGLQENPFSPNG